MPQLLSSQTLARHLSMKAADDGGQAPFIDVNGVVLLDHLLCSRTQCHHRPYVVLILLNLKEGSISMSNRNQVLLHIH